ncbi:SHD1 domain-containing protein [Pontiellaceae bacterium B12227]|nr:SHD1 domain-containing protein [Pontiellaceae bacterium B12227]
MLKPFAVLMILFLSLNCPAREMREWRSRDGSQTLTAQYIAIRNGKEVLLLGKEKQQVKVPVAKLSAEDQEYIFHAESRNVLNVAEAKIRGLAYRQGEILGPLEAEDGSSFFLYVPESLARDRLVPLMLFTGPTGGKMRYIKELIAGAEVAGWIVAVAVESNYYNSVDVNRSLCNSIVQTLLNTAPVDRRRLYFGGFSAGASVSYYSGAKWKACGLMPMSTYIPPRLDPPSCDTVIITGGSDFNRYTGAYARKHIGERAVHRFHAKGHETPPPWMMHDAMALLEARFLERDPTNNEQELSRFLYSMINWIDGFKEKHPHRTYHWACFLRNTFELNPLLLTQLDPLVEELDKNELNRLYKKGLDDLDELSRSYLSTITRESKLNFTDSALIAECEPLMHTHKKTPVIKETLEALCKQTDEPACVQPHWEE